jgi:hypothetical protein
MDEQGQPALTSGTSLDVSLYGLGILVPVALSVDRTVTVQLHGVTLFGEAQVCYSQPSPSGFRVGLQFRLALLMQGVPGLDDILLPPLRWASLERTGFRTSLLRWIAVRLWRASLVQDDRLASPARMAWMRPGESRMAGDEHPG